MKLLAKLNKIDKWVSYIRTCSCILGELMAWFVSMSACFISVFFYQQQYFSQKTSTGRHRPPPNVTTTGPAQIGPQMIYFLRFHGLSHTENVHS